MKRAFDDHHSVDSRCERTDAKEDSPSIAATVEIALILPHVHLMCFSGAVAVGYSLVNWNGNKRDMLLLRLVDEKPS